MTDAWPPQPDVFREAGLQFLYEVTDLDLFAKPRWNSDHEWAVARVHAKWHGRKEPEVVDLDFARAVLAELGEGVDGGR
jgi:hypothetical protein